MPLTVAGKNTSLEALRAAISHVGLLDVSQTEIAGGGYARVPCSFGPASGGAISDPTDHIINVPVCTVRHVAYFNAASGGTQLATDDIPPGADFEAPSTFTVADAVIDFNTP